MRALKRIHPKVTVTGSRGKSSLVRLIHSALVANGVKAYGKITGVISRELTPHGEVPVMRSSGGHVGEMKWWLSSLPQNAEAIVMENSAVSPDLQGLASGWLAPDVTVLTNLHPDHQEVWGPTENDAAMVLTQGIQSESRVILGPGLENNPLLQEILALKNCKVLTVTSPEKNILDFREKNFATALRVCEFLNLDRSISEEAMEKIPGDIADFRVIDISGRDLAFAFSVNDLESTKEILKLQQWRYQDTIVIYNHRKDRFARLAAFRKWLTDNPWLSLFITGDNPLLPWTWSHFRHSRDLRSLIESLDRGVQIFGCGNVAGLPLEFLLKREDLSRR